MYYVFHLCIYDENIRFSEIMCVSNGHAVYIRRLIHVMGLTYMSACDEIAGHLEGGFQILTEPLKRLTG